MLEKIKFYQTGSNTVGNRLITPAMRTIQASVDRPNSLTSGHRACQGCGEALGARYAIDAAMKATNGQIMIVNATGCQHLIQNQPGDFHGCTHYSVILHQ